MTDNRTQVFDVAMKNARTIEACVDRLSMMGADHELKLVAQRLTRLTFRLRHQPSKVRKGWAQPQSSGAYRGRRNLASALMRSRVHNRTCDRGGWPIQLAAVTLVSASRASSTFSKAAGL